MLKSAVRVINPLKISVFLIIATLLISGGCKSLMSGNTAVPTNEPQTPPAPVVVDGVRTSYADIVNKTSPAVVRIASERKAQQSSQQFPFGDFLPFLKQERQPRVERGAGSGVIVSANGTILTNYHVVEGSEKLTIQMLDNKTYSATIVGTDQPSDLAVLKIEGENFPFLNLGDSNQVRVGDIVLAIGNPLGIGQTVTAGIISAKGRQTGLSDGTSFQDFLQTDAPINRGNSGGALVNISGELIGINSQIVSDSGGGGGGGNIGIGFSIPSNMAKTVMEQLLNGGKVKRGMLGVGIQDVTEEVAKSLELKEAKGVLVNAVSSSGAAEKAGIKQGDIITAIDGAATDDTNVLRNKVAGTAPGTAIKITVWREGKAQDFTATLQEFEVKTQTTEQQNNQNQNNENKQTETGKLGLSVQPLTPAITREVGVPTDTQGLVIAEVDESGPAAEKGIERGDVVLQANNQAVKTEDEFQAAIGKSGNKPVSLLISRKGVTRYFFVTPK